MGLTHKKNLYATFLSLNFIIINKKIRNPLEFHSITRTTFMQSRGKKSLSMNWSQDITCLQQALKALKDTH